MQASSMARIFSNTGPRSYLSLGPQMLRGGRAARQKARAGPHGPCNIRYLGTNQLSLTKVIAGINCKPYESVFDLNR